MAQIGILSMGMLQTHDHYNYDTGGPILEKTRVASANIRILSAANRSTAAGAWVRVKQIYIGSDTLGAMDINYTLERTGGAGTAHAQARMYRGATLLWAGVDNSTAAGPTVYNDNAVQGLLIGDTIEMWSYKTGAGALSNVSQMECLWDNSITAISRVPVTVAIAITGAGIDYVVNS